MHVYCIIYLFHCEILLWNSVLFFIDARLYLLNTLHYILHSISFSIWIIKQSIIRKNNLHHLLHKNRTLCKKNTSDWHIHVKNTKKYFKLYYKIAVDCYEKIRNCYIILYNCSILKIKCSIFLDNLLNSNIHIY